MRTSNPLALKLNKTLLNSSKAASTGGLQATRLQPVSNTEPGYFTAFAPGYQENDPQIYNGNNEAICCPKCKVNKVTDPQLRQFYSKCCGCVRCSSCLNIETPKFPIPCESKGCIGILDRSSWSTDSIELQRYTCEVEQRQKYHQVFNLLITDFASKLQYDDYLEFLEDAIYDLKYGNTIVRQNTEKRIAEFKQTHMQQIYKNLSVSFEKANQEKNTLGAAPILYATGQSVKAYVDLLATHRRMLPSKVEIASTVKEKYEDMDAWDRRVLEVDISGQTNRVQVDMQLLSASIEAWTF